MTTDTLITTRIVNAPVQAVFEVLAEPANHAAIDGTGWVRESLDGKPLQEKDQIFRIAMYHDNLPEGHYEMANRVFAFEPSTTIAWEPGQEGPDGEIKYGGWTWRYDLEPVGDGTQVTMTYDWSGVPSETREHIEFPPFAVSHVENSLANLAKLAEGR
ncbi:activator of HSP90 ATPase [Mycolicibacterium arabiense]|uniref:Activator of HSP90 ATPase n=1 Tax=Mycolicibacterium arabiense TaxID=1286181 RepID=A0A7I7S0J6_9MYCO|nr:SRPBCC family protein [Mycolicibacterium arabiense]MCV7374469.1 SRPBCC family protein [Mycolicibacterium arabiense]BBY49729.1 activator of HSP90 ATPase [Mycolicibacterium arabiense]